MAVVVLVGLVATIGIVVLRDPAGAIAAKGCAGDATLRIAAAPELSSTLEEFADDFDTWVKDRAGVPCTTTQITAASPQELSEQVSRALDGDTANAPTTWVPDSSLWSSVLARDPRVSAVLPRTFPVVAATPVVFAAPRPMAEALGWPDEQPSRACFCKAQSPHRSSIRSSRWYPSRGRA